MAIVFALCAAYVAYCLGTNPAGPFTTPDSMHYLNASPIVPLGYPFFLKIVGARGAIVAQPMLFGAALAFLGSEIVRLTRSTRLAVAVVTGSMALPQIREFHASILSESLFLSLLIVFLAISVRFAYHPTWHLMVPVATAAGLDATVRRSAFALLPVMLLMVLFQRHTLRGSQPVRLASPAQGKPVRLASPAQGKPVRLASLAQGKPVRLASLAQGKPVRLASLAQGKPAMFFVAALAPFLVIVGAEQAIAAVVHAGASSSLFGRHMFAKAALIDAPPAPPSTDPVRAALDRHLQEDYAPIRAFLASAPPDLRAALEIHYETCLQGGCVDRSRALMPDLNESRQTETLGAAALARIGRAPLAFARLTAMNYLSLWTVDRLRHPDRAAALTAFIAAHRPMPFEDLAFSLEPGGTLAFQGAPRLRYMQWAIGIVGIVTAAIAVVGIVAAGARPRLPPLFAIAAGSALAAHSCLLLTALLASGFSRFTIGVWPAIVMAAAFGVWAMVRLRADATVR